MTDLEALHWLKRMKATVLLDVDHVQVVVAGDRAVVMSYVPELSVVHHEGFAEITAETLADATWQALQMWRAQRGAVDAIADLGTVPECCCNMTSGVCAHCGQPTIEHTEIDPDSFKLARAILCTACGTKTFIEPEEVDDARAKGALTR